MTPEQREADNERRRAQIQAQDYNKRYENAEQRAQRMEQQMVQLQLDQALVAPEMSMFVKDFDAKIGAPGSFREEVRQYGDYVYRTTGQVIPPQQAVQMIYNKHKVFFANNAAPVGPGGQAPMTSTHQPPPTLPNLGGSGRLSPTKRVPKNIEDLKKMAAAID